MIEVLEKIALESQNNNQSDGDYKGEDGLLYCGKCRTVKQTRVECLGRIITPVVPCKCEEERKKREKERENANRQKRRIENLRKECFPDIELVNWNFSADNGKGDIHAMNVVRNYADNFDKMYADGLGLLLYGGYGVGKTFAAACIANHLVDKGHLCLMTDFSRIINILTGMNQGKQEYIDSLNRYELLIIDDLAAERDTPYANEIVINVIDSRCKSGKPLIITTNLTSNELLKTTDDRKKRIYSRLLGMTIPVEYKGEDRRKWQMIENAARYKDLLGL